MKLTGLNGYASLASLRANFLNSKTAFERLSSGLRINRAADDPSGVGISTTLKSSLGGIGQAIRNVQEGISMLQTADAGAVEIGHILQRGRDLAVRAANEATLTVSDLQLMQNECDMLLEEINAIANSVKFNGKTLINGGSGTVYSFTSQADWQGGTYNATEIDLDSSPGAVKMMFNDWNTSVAWNTTIGEINQDTINLWMNGAAAGSGYDTANGTYTARFYIGGEILGAGGQLKGKITFDAGAVLSNASNGSISGNTFNFDLTAAAAFNGSLAYVDITAPVDSKWQLHLTDRNSEPIRMYWGNQLMGNTRPAVFYSGYFTDINPSATYATSAVDTQNATGGTATLSYGASTGAGKNVQVFVYESADGVGGWNLLPLVGNGESFEYSQRFLRAEVTLMSNGVMFGTPSLTDLTFTLSEGVPLQIGHENKESQREYFTAWNLMTSSLGVAGINLSDNSGAALLLDTQLEWLSGTSNLVNMDLLSNSGTAQLEPDIAITGNPDKQDTFSVVVSVNSATPRSDGYVDYVVSVRYWGMAAQNIIWQGDFHVEDSNGAVTFDEVYAISTDWTGTVPINPYTGRPPISYGLNGTRDAVYGVIGNQFHNVPNPDGTITAGGYEWVYIDASLGNQMDGFAVKFTALPDATFDVDFLQHRRDAARNSLGAVIDPNQRAVIYYGDNVIADRLASNPAWNTAVDAHRFFEFTQDGSFSTNATYVGANTSASISGMANDGVNTAYEVWASADGVNWTEQLITAGSGVSNFTTSADKPFVQVRATLFHSAAVVDTSVAGVYNYTPSSSPQIGSLGIITGVNPISKFQAAIDKLSETRGEIGMLENKLNFVLSDLQMQRINIAAANSNIEDADIAVEALRQARSAILIDSATAAVAQGQELAADSVTDLLDGHGMNVTIHDIAENAVRTSSTDK